MNKQPHRVRLQLPDSNGVVLESVCALCHDGIDGIVCPICSRMFCTEPCFGVHLNARDAIETVAIDVFLASSSGQKLVEDFIAEYDATDENDKIDDDIDWPHVKHCMNCRETLRPIAIEAALLAAMPPDMRDQRKEKPSGG